MMLPATPINYMLVYLLALVGLASAYRNPEGQAYLDENAKKEGVVVLPSGVQYEVLHSGPVQGPHQRRSSTRARATTPAS